MAGNGWQVRRRKETHTQFWELPARRWLCLSDALVVWAYGCTAFRFPASHLDDSGWVLVYNERKLLILTGKKKEKSLSALCSCLSQYIGNWHSSSPCSHFFTRDPWIISQQFYSCKYSSEALAVAELKPWEDVSCFKWWVSFQYIFKCGFKHNMTDENGVAGLAE